MDVMTAAGMTTVVVVGGGAAVAAGRALWRIGRSLDTIREDWQGEPDRPGVPGRLGVMARLGQIDGRLDGMDGRLRGVEQQVSPNGGGSLYDKITTMAAASAPEEGS